MTILLDKNVPKAQKESLIKDHIFKFGDEPDYRIEIQAKIERSHEIQNKLRELQAEKIYDPIQLIEKASLKQGLDKKMMEFTGMTLISMIKNPFRE